MKSHLSAPPYIHMPIDNMLYNYIYSLSSLIISHFGFSTCIVFIMLLLDICYIQVHSKIYISRKVKMTNNLERKEYMLNNMLLDQRLHPLFQHDIYVNCNVYDSAPYFTDDLQMDEPENGAQVSSRTSAQPRTIDFLWRAGLVQTGHAYDSKQHQLARSKSMKFRVFLAAAKTQAIGAKC